MTGLILAAGIGTRMSSGKTDASCKPLKEVNGKPLILYSLDVLKTAGIESAVIVVGRYYKEIEEAVGQNYNGISVRYEIQDEQKGLSHAIFCGIRNLNDDVMLLLADELFINSKPGELLTLFESDIADYIVTFTKENDVEEIKKNFSFEINESGRPYNFIEKPTSVLNDMKGTGVCVFNKKSIDILKQKYDEKTNLPNTLCDYFELLNEDKMTGKAFEFASIEINVNTLYDLEHANRLLKGDV